MVVLRDEALLSPLVQLGCHAYLTHTRSRLRRGIAHLAHVTLLLNPREEAADAKEASTMTRAAYYLFFPSIRWASGRTEGRTSMPFATVLPVLESICWAGGWTERGSTMS